MKRVRVPLMVGVAMAVLVALLCLWQPEVLELLRGPNWSSFALDRRAGLQQNLSSAMFQYAEAHDGAVPNTLDELVGSKDLAVPEWATVLARDDRTNRVRHRAVFVRDFIDRRGKHYKWIFATHLPRRGPLDPFTTDLIVISAGTLSSRGSLTFDPGFAAYDVKQARDEFGDDIVDRAIRRYWDDVGKGVKRAP